MGQAAVSMAVGLHVAGRGFRVKLRVDQGLNTKEAHHFHANRTLPPSNAELQSTMGCLRPFESIQRISWGFGLTV